MCSAMNTLYYNDDAKMATDRKIETALESTRKLLMGASVTSYAVGKSSLAALPSSHSIDTAGPIQSSSPPSHQEFSLSLYAGIMMFVLTMLLNAFLTRRPRNEKRKKGRHVDVLSTITEESMENTPIFNISEQGSFDTELHDKCVSVSSTSSSVVTEDDDSFTGDGQQVEIFTWTRNAPPRKKSDVTSSSRDHIYTAAVAASALAAVALVMNNRGKK